MTKITSLLIYVTILTAGITRSSQGYLPEIRPTKRNGGFENPQLNKSSVSSPVILYAEADNEWKDLYGLTNKESPPSHSDQSSWNSIQSRKQALATVSALATMGILTTGSMSSFTANAFEKTFPTDLAEEDVQDSTTIITIGRRSNTQQRKQAAEQAKEKMNQNLVNFNVKNDLLPSTTWGLALWFLSGSRSNPVVTPLANLFYSEQEEKWLQDRNAGLFAKPPIPFLLILSLIFLCLGTVTQFFLLQLAEGDSIVCGQLAGVALIGGGFLEIGRIASGEKRMTRDELDRTLQLKEEFDEFAKKRLLPGGNCHRSDVVKAFRRYHAKYRQADSEDYPLTDLEIEKLLRGWNQIENLGKAEMSSGGFYYGIQINKDADVFV